MQRTLLILGIGIALVVGADALRAQQLPQIDRTPARREIVADSLLRIIPSLKDDTTIADHYALLATLFFEVDGPRSLRYVDQARTYAARAKNQQRIDGIEQFMIDWYSSKGQYDSARAISDRIYRAAERRKDTAAMAQVLQALAWNDNEQGNYRESVDMHFRVLKLVQAAHLQNMLPAAYNGLGTLYFDQKDYPNALHYLRLGLTESYRLNDSSGIAAMENNIGLIYLDTDFFHPKNGPYLDSAELGFRRAVAIWQGHGGLMLQRSTANIARCFELRGLNDSALFYYRSAVAIHRATGDSTTAAAGRCYACVGALFRRLRQYDSASYYLHRAVRVCREGGARRDLVQALRELAEYYHAIGNDEEGYRYLREWSSLRDSIFNSDRARMLTEMQARYRTAEKEKQIGEQAKELRNRETILYSSLGGTIVLAAFGLVLMRNNRRKKRLSDSLREAKERAERSEQYEKQFLANMSHEIRTPMNAVMGLTSLLLDTEHSPKQNEYLSAIKRSSEHLLVIINDILDLSKLKEGKMELERIPFRVRERITYVADIMRIKAEEKGLQLTSQIEADVPPVLVGDPGRLSQILLNLVGNAIKFTQKGSVTIGVSVLRSTELGALLRFSVRDTGIGIAPDKLSTVFESFKQAESHTSRTYGGTGLGLSISKTLVELAGGDISVESTVGTGSKFSFTMPLAIGHEEDLVENASETDYDPRSLSGIRILLAEDNEYNRLVLIDTVHHLVPDAQIVTATNGAEALSESQRSRFDVILMDVQMPEMDGIEATRRIRSLDGPVKNTPIVALTASVIRGDIDHCLAAGMNGYVPKPFRRSELLGALQEIYAPSNRSRATTAELPISHEPNSFSIIDLSFLTEFTGGEEDQMRKYIRMFVENTPTQMQRIGAALAANDLDLARRTVHALKPQFKFMGMAHGASLAESIEQACGNGVDVNAISNDFAALERECDGAIAELRIRL
ncbi:MAG: response regulator [Bacteroidetes bacterium]|nr:response regulator [Bacteroidota bacterium]